MDLDSVEKTISAGRYRPTFNEPLRTRVKISDVWNEQPPDQHLHVFVSLPGGIDRPMLVHNGGECFMRVNASLGYLTDALPEVEQFGCVDPLVQDYMNIFVKVNKQGMFEPSDIERNQIQNALSMPLPGFVTGFEQKMVRKPRLRPDVRYFLDLSVCGSILMGQRRCTPYCRCSTFLDHVLSLPRTRSPETNLTKKRAMPSYQRWCIQFSFRNTIGKELGNRWGPINAP